MHGMKKRKNAATVNFYNACVRAHTVPDVVPACSSSLSSFFFAATLPMPRMLDMVLANVHGLKCPQSGSPMPVRDRSKARLPARSFWSKGTPSVGESLDSFSDSIQLPACIACAAALSPGLAAAFLPTSCGSKTAHIHRLLSICPVPGETEKDFFFFFPQASSPGLISAASLAARKPEQAQLCQPAQPRQNQVAKSSSEQTARRTCSTNAALYCIAPLSQSRPQP